MVSQGSLCEEDGILPDYPYVWESDDAIPRTPPEFEEFSSIEGDSTMTDEDLIDEVSGCPTIRRLQAVARRYKFRAFFAKGDLERERALVARLEVQAQQDAERISELTTYLLTLALDRDEARKQARKWKICVGVLGVIVTVCVLVV